MDDCDLNQPQPRQRAPRVHVTYERDIGSSETGPVIEVCELPFVIGVLADLGGQPEAPAPPLRERAFVEVNRENFDQLRDAFAHVREAGPREAAWRGLHYLLSSADVAANVRIRVLNAGQQELLEDFRAAGSVERSALFQSVYAAVYGRRLAEPFSALIGDYEFGHGPEHVELLTYLSELAAAAHAPLIAAASPEMFGCRAFAQLPAASALARRFDDEAYVRWRSFRDTEAAVYVGLVVPHILLGDASGCVWGNAAYALAVRLAEAFRQYGWCAAVCGVESGGLVTGLAADGDAGPTDLPIPEDLEQVLHQLGFVSLCHWKRTGLAAFFSIPSCRRPRLYDLPEATAAAALAARLPYVLVVSRFAHYLKVMVRDRLGGPLSREGCEQYLNAWISQYVVLEDGAPNIVKAMYPLREARVEVHEDVGRQGARFAVAHLRPHFQLADPGLCLRVVAELPAAG